MLRILKAVSTTVMYVTLFQLPWLQISMFLFVFFSFPSGAPSFVLKNILVLTYVLPL